MECDPMRMCELLVGLGDVEVLGVDDEGVDKPLRVHVRRRALSPRCGDCGGLLWSKGERRVVLVDLPALGRAVRLVWHKRRWRCPRSGCGAGSFTEQAAQIAPERALLTTRAGRWATRRAGRGDAVGDIAAVLGCDWHTVNASVRRWGSAPVGCGHAAGLAKCRLWGLTRPCFVVGAGSTSGPGRPASSMSDGANSLT